MSTVKLEYNDHPRGPKILAVVDRWLLFKGDLCNKSLKWDLKTVGVSSGLTVLDERWLVFRILNLIIKM